MLAETRRGAPKAGNGCPASRSQEYYGRIFRHAEGRRRFPIWIEFGKNVWVLAEMGFQGLDSGIISGMVG
jgi:hypothetical protein